MNAITRHAAYRVTAAFVSAALLLAGPNAALASDHFDSSAMAANPPADIADVYAWTAEDGRRLNLVMTIVGHAFSDRVAYEFHIDSGQRFGRTTASTLITCRFAEVATTSCRLGRIDAARGDARNTDGVEGEHHRFRVFAGLRDDPFYNNVPGSIAVYHAETAAIAAGARVDASGCPHLSNATAQTIAHLWSSSPDGGPPANLLANWTASAIVMSVDLAAVSGGGRMLAVWGTTSSPQHRLDHMGRPFVANTLLGSTPFSEDAPSGVQRQRFNETSRTTARTYIPRIERSLALNDGLDGVCGNQLLAHRAHSTVHRYRELARVFADDRLWVNTASRTCTQFFAVELAALDRRSALANDCGGRTPVYGAPDVWRSLLVDGTTNSVSDGLDHDEHVPSATVFPFLVPPDPHGINH